jgi:hypothetical protein
MSLKIICSPRPLGSADIAATAVTADPAIEVAAAGVGGIRTWVVPGVVARAVPPP